MTALQQKHKFIATKIVENGVAKWVTVPVVDDAEAPLKTQQEPRIKVTPYTGYSYYGIWEDND